MSTFIVSEGSVEGRDPTCLVMHPSHRCRDRDGNLVRDGKSCWLTARAETLQVAVDTLGLRERAA
jgi:hypothetical protein